MLANAVGHSPDTSTDTPPSGASRTVAPPLPQFNPVQFPGSGRLSGRRAVDLDLDFDLRRPVKPRWPNAGITERVNRQDAGLAATGQGRPVAAARGVMPERGHTEPEARCRVVGQEPFWLLLGLFSKSDPRKAEPIQPTQTTDILGKPTPTFDCVHTVKMLERACPR